MDRANAFAKALAYMRSQSESSGGRVEREVPRMAVAMSRQTGSGAIRIAEQLADYLDAQQSADEQPWTVFDKELISKVLEDHHLPARLAKFLPEDKVNAVEDAVDEILGLHPPTWVVVRQSVETILNWPSWGMLFWWGAGPT